MSGCPITALTNETILAVREIIEENPYSTFDQNEALKSLHHLGLRKITSRYVPHELSAKNKEDRVRRCDQNLA